MRKAQFLDPHYSRFLRRPDLQPLPKATALKEERALFEAIRAGDAAARDRIIKVNTKFAAAVARQYKDRGLPFDDLFSEAVVGMMKAVDKFDPNQGFKFISYAIWWMRQNVLMALAAQSRTYTMPPRYFTLSKRLESARTQLEQDLGRAPSNVETAAAMRMTVAEVVEIRNLTLGAISLDTERWVDGPTTLGDLLVSDERSDRGAEEVSEQELVRDLLKVCDPREREILEAYYGLDGMGGGLTLDDLGRRFGLTRERIRQIKDTATKKMQRGAEVRQISWQG